MGLSYVGAVLHLVKEAGPFAFLCIGAGGLGAMLAVATLVLAAQKSKAASVTGVLCLLLAFGIFCLGVFGYSLGMAATNRSLGNVPDEMKHLLLRKGAEEARANFLIALICAALPLLAGALAVVVRRLVAGIAFAGVVTLVGVTMLYAFTLPLPPAGPRVATVPGLELPRSSSTRRLGPAALIALTPDGLWADGTKTPSLTQALTDPEVAERNTVRLPLLVDRRVQFGQLADVLQAASAAGRHSVELVVQAADGTESVITLRDAPDAPAAVPLLLTLSITDEALQLGATGGSLDPLPRDWRALNDKVAEIKASFPGERTLRVTATPETPVGDLVAALDAVRERDGRLLFDELVVGRFTLPKPADRVVVSEPQRDAELRGRVADAAPEVGASGVDRDLLNRYVRARRAVILACYEKELRRDPLLKGKVVVRFTIATTGHTKEIEIIDSTLGNDTVGLCIKAVIRVWVLPFKPESDVSVALPFVFAPAT